MTKSTLRGLLIGLLVVGGIGAVTYLNRTTGVSDQLVSEVRRDRHPVETQRVEPQTLRETIERTGTLGTNLDVTLTASVTARAIKLHRPTGTRCRKGQVALQLEREAYAIALQQASAALQQAEAQASQARRQVKRLSALAKRSTVSAQSLEQAQTAAQTAAAAVAQAKAGARLARRNLRETTIRCPFAGLVAAVPVAYGELVTPQTPLLRLVDDSSLILTIGVTAAELNRLRVGQPVRLSDPADPERSYAGTVKTLGVVADAQSHTFPVEIRVPGGADGPRAGQVVQASVEVALHPGVLAVEDDLVQRQQSKRTLFVVRGERAERCELKLGPKVGSLRIVRQGLKAGDRVVVVGTEGLRDGARVQLTGAGATSGAARAAPTSRPGAADR